MQKKVLGRLIKEVIVQTPMERQPAVVKNEGTLKCPHRTVSTMHCWHGQRGTERYANMTTFVDKTRLNTYLYLPVTT